MRIDLSKKPLCAQIALRYPFSSRQSNRSEAVKWQYRFRNCSVTRVLHSFASRRIPETSRDSLSSTRTRTNQFCSVVARNSHSVCMSDRSSALIELALISRGDHSRRHFSRFHTRDYERNSEAAAHLIESSFPIDPIDARTWDAHASACRS